MPERYPEEVEAVLSLISEAKLAHPLDLLLQHFIVDALDPRLPARYILQKCDSGQGRQVSLSQIVSDWKFILESSMSDFASPLTLFCWLYGLTVL